MNILTRLLDFLFNKKEQDTLAPYKIEAPAASKDLVKKARKPRIVAKLPKSKKS
jgi:hypothetical protein